MPFPELLVFVVVVMFTVLFPPVGLVTFAVRPPDSLLVVSATIDVLLFVEWLLLPFALRAHTLRFLPVFVALVVEPVAALPTISKDVEECCPLLL